jgi:hypothetical protein
MAKAGALQSYPAKTFYLPVPEAKHILAKRVSFVKLKLKAEPAAAREYFSRKGFTVGIKSLEMFANAIERVFVETEYVSGLIGRLANFDIRRMLELAQRVFLSPEIEIDEVVKSSFGGPPVTSDLKRTHRALIKGEYDRFSEEENSFMLNIFWTNPERPASPLLAFYILWALRHRGARADDTSAEAKHWGIAELCDYLEPCGVDRQSVFDVLNRLFAARLIDTFDPTREKLTETDRIAIKDAGHAHIDLLQDSTIYLEEMALVTGLNQPQLRQELKEHAAAKSRGSYRAIVASFTAYLNALDSSRFTIPQATEYTPLTEAQRAFASLTARAREDLTRVRPFGKGPSGQTLRARKAHLPMRGAKKTNARRRRQSARSP